MTNTSASIILSNYILNKWEPTSIGIFPEKDDSDSQIFEQVVSLKPVTTIGNITASPNKKDLKRDRQRGTAHAVPFTLFRWGRGGRVPLFGPRSSGRYPLSGPKSGPWSNGGRATPCPVPGLVEEAYPVPGPVGEGRGWGCPEVHGTHHVPFASVFVCGQKNWKHYLPSHSVCGR